MSVKPEDKITEPQVAHFAPLPKLPFSNSPSPPKPVTKSPPLNHSLPTTNSKDGNALINKPRPALPSIETLNLPEPPKLNLEFSPSSPLKLTNELIENLQQPPIPPPKVKLVESGDEDNSVGGPLPFPASTSPTPNGYAALPTEDSPPLPPIDSDDKNSPLSLDAEAKRKNSEFHSLFHSIPIDEILIADYGCAIQKGTLVQGRLYITKNYVCFHSSIFGWVNRIAIPYTEIIFVEKRHVAYVIPSAIQVATLHHKYVFTSFRNRDGVMMQLIGLWKEARINVVDSDDTDKVEDTGYKAVPSTGSDGNESDYEQVDFQSPQGEKENIPSKEEETVHDENKIYVCPCYSSEHYPNLALDTRFDLPVSTMFDLIYGDTPFLSDFLNEQGCTDVVIGEWEGKHRKITYVKPLTNPLGPRSTRCVVDQHQITHKNHTISVVETIESLDVPSASAFRAKVRVCLMSHGKESTRIVVTGGSEWLKSSWIKGAIDRGIIDGNSKYFTDLEISLRKFDTSPPVNSSGSNEKVTLPLKPVPNQLKVEPTNTLPPPPGFLTRIQSTLSTVGQISRKFATTRLAPNQRLSHWTSYLLIGLAVVLCAINLASWRRAIALSNQLQLLQQKNPDVDFEASLKDLVHFTNQLRASVQLLNNRLPLPPGN